jgi:predicted Zn-ribbon and HTH transcriptional regulator
MGTITYTRPAKCKDCRYHKDYRPLKKDGTKSKLRRFKCNNIESAYYNSQTKLNDLACDKWAW